MVEERSVAAAMTVATQEATESGQLPKLDFQRQIYWESRHLLGIVKQCHGDVSAATALVRRALGACPSSGRGPRAVRQLPASAAPLLSGQPVCIMTDTRRFCLECIVWPLARDEGLSRHRMAP